MVEPHTLAMKRVSVKSSCGRIPRTTCSTPGFCRPIAFSMPAGVSYTRCGGLPRRGSPVVPLRTTAPASRLEKPSMRVYSSPKPTQPESSTIGEAKSMPQNFRLRRAAASGAAAGADRRVAVPDAAALLSLKFCGMDFASPIVLLSGCVGFGEEYTRIEGFSNRDAGAVEIGRAHV